MLLKFVNKHTWLVFLLIVLLIYWRLPSVYWQQDEWHHLGQEYLWHSQGIWKFVVKDSISFFGLRFLPLANLTNFFQFGLFGQNPIGYSLVSVLLHATNVYLVYLLTDRLFNKRHLSWATALLFASSPLASQAVSWRIQHTTTLPALTFSLVAILLMFSFWRRKQLKYYLWSVFAVLVAVAYKETAFFLFPFLILLPLILGKRVNRFYWSFLITVPLLYLFFFFGVLFNSGHQATSVSSVSVVTANNQAVINLIFRRLVSVPAKVITQSFVSPQTVIKLAHVFYNSPFYQGPVFELGSPEKEMFLEGVVSKRLIYGLAVIIGLALVAFVKIFRERKLLIPSFLLLSCAFPLLYVGGFGSSFVFLEPRYLYIPLVGSAMLISFILEKLFRRLRIWFWLIILVTVLMGASSVGSDLNKQYMVGNLRRKILQNIELNYPQLPERVVFYTESDRSYYGLPETEKILPFQSGLGQTLLVYYYPKEKYPVDYFLGDFLWGIESQEYKEKGGRGFGYFRDLNLLKRTVIENKLPLESVIAFLWNSKTQSLVDISSEIRHKLTVK